MPKEMSCFYEEESLLELFMFDYGDEPKLDFDYIQNYGCRIVMIVDAMVSKAKKFNLFDHEIDPKIEQ